VVTFDTSFDNADNNSSKAAAAAAVIGAQPTEAITEMLSDVQVCNLSVPSVGWSFVVSTRSVTSKKLVVFITLKNFIENHQQLRHGTSIPTPLLTAVPTSQKKKITHTTTRTFVHAQTLILILKRLQGDFDSQLKELGQISAVLDKLLGTIDA
jgi:hypothetical protein